jgi:hypothetical protein
MTRSDINRMVEIQGMMDSLSSELETLKAMARNESNGTTCAFQGDMGTVTVSKPRASYQALDTAVLKARAPKLYSELMSKYSKTVNGGTQAVKVYINK